jgi:hypothetical protein
MIDKHGKVVVLPEDSMRTLVIQPRPIFFKIDKPKPYMLTQAVRHPSKSGWNRNHDDPHYWNALPTGETQIRLSSDLIANNGAEIQERILSFVVTLPKGVDEQCLEPKTHHSNWRSHWKVAGYDIVEIGIENEVEHELSPPIAFFEQKDRRGAFTAIAKIKKVEIDASICRVMNKLANRMLYQSNTFYFRMNGPSREQCLRVMLPDKEETVHWPIATKLFNTRQIWTHHRWEDSAGDIKLRVEEAVLHVHTQKVELINGQAVPDLDVWAYYDHLIHFLWTIGPKNSAMIKFICLSGSLKRHEVCKSICKSDCGDDIAECVNLYIPFHFECTPNLETLIIIAHDDWQYRPKPDPNGPPNSKIVVSLASIMERAFKPLLQDRLRILPKLKKLNFRAKEVDRYDWGTSYKDVTYPWAEEAAEWFRLRGLQHDAQRKKRQQVGEEAQRAAARLENLNLTNDSQCANGGVAMTYAKVCEFCTEVGHIQVDCKRWGKSRA